MKLNKTSPGTETCVTWLCEGLVTPHTVVTTERDPACWLVPGCQETGSFRKGPSLLQKDIKSESLGWLVGFRRVFIQNHSPTENVLLFLHLKIMRLKPNCGLFLTLLEHREVIDKDYQYEYNSHLDEITTDMRMVYSSDNWGYPLLPPLNWFPITRNYQNSVIAANQKGGIRVYCACTCSIHYRRHRLQVHDLYSPAAAGPFSQSGWFYIALQAKERRAWNWIWMGTAAKLTSIWFHMTSRSCLYQMCKNWIEYFLLLIQHESKINQFHSEDVKHKICAVSLNQVLFWLLSQIGE